MAVTVGAVASTKLFIGGTTVSPPSPDLYTEVKNVSNLGTVMTQFAKIAVESVGDGYTRQIKGTQSAPEFALSLNRDDTDAGQTLLKAATADRNSFYQFKILENDGITVTTFKARVYGFGTAYGGVNDLKKTNTTLEIEPDSIVTTTT